MLRLALSVALLSLLPSVATACDHAQILQVSTCPQQYVQPYVQQYIQPYVMQYSLPPQPVLRSYSYAYAAPQQVVVRENVVVRQRLGFRGRRALRLQARADRASIRAGLSAPVRARVIIAH